MRHLDWEDILNHLQYQEALAVELYQNSQKTNGDTSDFREKLKLVCRDASKKVYRKYAHDLKKYQRLVEYLTLIEAAGVEAVDDESKRAIYVQEILTTVKKAISFVTAQMKSYRLKSEVNRKAANQPTIFWFVHPVCHHPEDFIAGKEYETKKLEGYPQELHRFVNGINRFYEVLKWVDADDFSMVFVLLGQEFKAPPAVMDLVKKLESQDKLLFSEASFPKEKGVKALAAKVEKRFGFRLQNCRHLLAGLSTPNCVSLTATMLYHNLLYAEDGVGLVKSFLYAKPENIFAAPQFTMTNSPYLKFCAVEEHQIGLQKKYEIHTDQEVGYVPTTVVK